MLAGCGNKINPKTGIVTRGSFYVTNEGEPVPPEGIRRMVIITVDYENGKIIRANGYTTDLAGNLDLSKVKEATFSIYDKGPSAKLGLFEGTDLIIRDRGKYYSAIFVGGKSPSTRTITYSRMTIKDIKPMKENETLRYLPDRPPVNSALIKGLTWQEPEPESKPVVSKTEPKPKEIE